MSEPIYEGLDVAILLRCNGGCRNCIRLCCSQDVTGLDYRDLDMTEADLRYVIGEVQRVADKTGRQPLGYFCLTGGEPTLHPELEHFFDIAMREVQEAGLCKRVTINLNGTRMPPKRLVPHVVHWWSVAEGKPAHHTCVLADPACAAITPMTRGTCQHYRRDRPCVTKQGFSLCCAAEGYIRLFAAEDLILPTLPASLVDWPNMDRICEHCAFAAPHQLYERDAGAPCTGVFPRECELNKAGRKITRRLPS